MNAKRILLLIFAIALGLSVAGGVQAATHPHKGSWPYKGDQGVRQGLLVALAQTAKLERKAVAQALKEGKSIAEIAAQSGTTADAVLAAYDAVVEQRFDKAVASGKLPGSLAESRKSWFKAAARQMIGQPGLRPAYPGLHELHSTIIGAAARTSKLKRSTIREELQKCRSLKEILAEHGHQASAAAEAAMQQIDTALDKLMQSGRMSAEQQRSWHDSISAALNRMVETPGLHVAGKQCAH